MSAGEVRTCLWDDVIDDATIGAVDLEEGSFQNEHEPKKRVVICGMMRLADGLKCSKMEDNGHKYGVVHVISYIDEQIRRPSID